MAGPMMSGGGDGRAWEMLEGRVSCAKRPRARRRQMRSLMLWKLLSTSLEIRTSGKCSKMGMLLFDCVMLRIVKTPNTPDSPNITLMNVLDYFKVYKQVLERAITQAKKVNFKRMTSLKDLVETLEVFLSKDTSGRILPGNYLLLLLLLLGTRNVKLIEIGIATIYKLYSLNFIRENEELSLSLIREEFKEYLLVDVSLLRIRTFKEIYLESLMQIQERDEGIILLIAKNLSLIVRMFQHSLDVQSVLGVQEHLANEVVSVSGRGMPIEKVLKSTLIQILRHVLENLRELDYNVLLKGEGNTIESCCKNTLTLIVDEIVMGDAVRLEYPDVTAWRMIPETSNFKDFKVKRVSTDNQNNEINGKFGWCVKCRKPADFYCKLSRVPVCSFECKTKYLQELQEFDKTILDESKAEEVFVLHGQSVIEALSRDLTHSDPRRRVLSAQIVHHILTEPRRFRTKNLVKNQLSHLFKNSLLNLTSQTQAFNGSIIVIKKLLHMNTFVDQIQLLIQLLIRKLENIQILPEHKTELLKLCKELCCTDVTTDIFINLDCEYRRKNAVERLVKTVGSVYAGLVVPGIAFEENARVKTQCIEVINDLVHYLGELNKKADKIGQEHILSLTKESKGKIEEAITLFNNQVKPLKGIKQLIKLEVIREDPSQVALFLHKNLDILQPSKLGQFLGSHDQFCIKCLSSFISLISFKDLEIDDAMRNLLDYFTLPSESQQVSRVIEAFSDKFYADNRLPDVFSSSALVYQFSYLLMMLQSNLHNPTVVDKMKFVDFQKLANNLKEDGDFPVPFLQQTYNSIQKHQLGFHEKQKEKDFTAAYLQGGKKFVEIYQKQLQKLSRRVQTQFFSFSQVTPFEPRVNCIRQIWSSLHPSIISALNLRLNLTQDKDHTNRVFIQFQDLIKLSVDNELLQPQQKIFLTLYSNIANYDNTSQRQNSIIQNLLRWSQKYIDHLGTSWKVVFGVISKFQRRKSIVKFKDAKESILAVAGERVYIYEPFVEGIFAKSQEYKQDTVLNMLNGLIDISRGEIQDQQQIFSLQKILDLVEFNLPRLSEIFPLIWPPLREYFIQLGLSSNEKIALFGVDFLKQFVLKLMKKKDTIQLQKDYFRLYETIFSNCELEGVKEFIIGSVSSVSAHSAPQLKQAWKSILSIYSLSFENQHSEQTRMKAFQGLNRLVETSLPYLQDYFVDLVQVLGQLSKQKQEHYAKGSLKMIEEIIQYYNKKLSITPEGENDVDISFLQATWLPLLGILSTISGDHRQDLQAEAMNYLFNLLMTYGGLFKYEFWKMVFQGVIRPTFDQILYTYQIRATESNKKDLTSWLKSSCEKLFQFILQLVNKYFNNFRLFLTDIFKIYENCIQNSNELLTKLSINAVRTLIERVGDRFIDEDWDYFLLFLDTLFKKTTPSELASVESWRASKLDQENHHSETFPTKCLSQLMLLGVAEEVLQKFSVRFTDIHLQSMKQMVTDSYDFTSNFNKQLDLRNSLWQEGFLSEMKQLPGLLKQERESLKCLLLLQSFRYQLAQQKHEESDQRFQEYIQLTLSTLELYLSKQRHLVLVSQGPANLQRQQAEREAFNMRILVRDTLIPQLEEMDIQLLKPYKNKFFRVLLEMLKYSSSNRSPCQSCTRCDRCLEILPMEVEFAEEVNRLVVGLFQLQ